MNKRIAFYGLVVVLLLPFETALGISVPGMSPVEGDSTGPAATYQLRATRVHRPPSIDGHLSESVWKTAETATDFTQFKPDPGAPGADLRAFTSRTMRQPSTLALE